ncbi:M61 family metallopeptidase [Flexithrix dorotheae]|uniref:M61 family metallopeptidase n=1 Tax=Flexithrix dorotheae TaxID=70993 RepID=UPI00036ACED9|nr:M61 family metallopeptidase [Flexithrix dorotheae]
MKYKISIKNPLSHFIDFELLIDKKNQQYIKLQLPAWRPGRYELQNFAKNIRGFSAFGADGSPLKFQKITKDKWKILCEGQEQIKVKYQYFANQMDAGGSWLDDEQLYINWVNCAFFIPGEEDKTYQMELNLPTNYEIASSLTQPKKNLLLAKNYFELFDSPLIASANLQHNFYEYNGIKFHIWIQGNWTPDWDVILNDFKKFTHSQFEIFGNLPTTDYHFLFQILPYRHYHGVEHANSTVITLGPSEMLQAKLSNDLYLDFLGVSSHELFHAWNVCRIRPKEMQQYDYSQENYFDTGYVAEGITTYYGDLMLKRSGVFTQELYLKELNKLLKRHFENYGRLNLSLADSSFDLWLDGYSKGIPDRKVSIYIKGALVALMLDLTLRINSNHQKSLDDVMALLWEKFGSNGKGYATDDILQTVNQVSQQNFSSFFQDYIYDVVQIEENLLKLLVEFGLTLQTETNDSPLAGFFGIKCNTINGKIFISQIAPESPAEGKLFLNDEIIAIDYKKAVEENIDLICAGKNTLVVSVFRNNVLQTIGLEKKQNTTYFKKYLIKPNEKSTSDQLENLKKWMGR